ncbi:MAG: hypothetical protein JWN90_613 [Parcubacteria group bacterium]|nr:hypothetical protein [Parcubacteria group bacterium]
MPPEQKSALEALNERLYRPTPTAAAGVPEYSNQAQTEQYGWTPPPPPPPPKPHMSWTLRFLIGTGIFFVLAGAVAAALVIYGGRTISSDHVVITITTPSPTIASGDTVPIVITVHNGNPTAMNDANVYVTLPPGTRSGTDANAELSQYADTIGTVSAGGDSTRTVQAKLFGTEHQVLQIPVRVEYHVTGSSALYVANKQYEVTVSTSPISVQVQTLSESASGQPLTLSVIVRSNATTPLNDLSVVAEFPFGFSLASATPKPAQGSYFVLGALAPGEEKVIKITGVLTGESADQRVFRFTAGSANPDGTSTLGVTYSNGSATVSLTKPFLATSLSLNGQAADATTAIPGAPFSALLSWQNSLTVPLTDASIQVALSGNALDTSAIKGGTGFYRSSDKTVIFSKDTNGSLATLQAGDSGVGSFSFAVKSESQLAGVTNPSLTLTVSATGKYSQQGNAPQSLTSTLTRTIKINTNVALTSTLSRTGGTVANTGPVPPKAGTETTYTVQLSARNSLNSVGGAKMTAVLPAYVRFVAPQTVAGASNPITYDDSSRTVIWNVGDVNPKATATASFQIAFLPSTSQNGTSPIVLGAQTFTGTDRFTQSQVTSTGPALTSELPNNASSGIVH